MPLNIIVRQRRHQKADRQSRRSERKAPPADAPRALCAAPQRAVCVAARRGSNAVSRAFWDYIFGSGCVAKWICAVVWLGRGRPRARGIPVPAARCVGPQRPWASQQAQVDVSGTGWHGSGDSCGRMGALVGKFLWLSTRAGARGGDGRRRHGDADHHRGVTPSCSLHAPTSTTTPSQQRRCGSAGRPRAWLTTRACVGRAGGQSLWNETGQTTVRSSSMLPLGQSGPSDSHHKALLVCFNLAFLSPVSLLVRASFLDLV